MDKTLEQFYAVSEIFRDDERLMAIAIKELAKPKDTKCSIYKDLLNCRYNKWISKIEQVAPLINDDYLNYKEFMFDNGHDTTFTKGDIYMIEFICMDEDI